MQIHLLSILSLLSLIVTGLSIGRFYFRRVPRLPVEAFLYHMATLNVSFLFIMLAAHIVSSGEDVDDLWLWAEGILANIIYIISLYVGYKSNRGVIE